jgi:2-keto-4-pentenoate hydratase/2-oxohepta-3-ene-1,7-dioic acid hydratase in catechol pathway
MPALVAGIHALLTALQTKTWMAGTSPAMTGGELMSAGYKLATYASPNGPRAGIIVGETVYDAATLTGQASDATVLGILENWDAAAARCKAAAAKAGKSGGTPLAQAKLLTPVRWPSAIYCAGANFTDHMLEMAKVQNIAPEPDPKSVGLKPWHFIKASRTIADPGKTVALPTYSKMVDWEAELGAFIGRPARNVPVERALDYVAGYTVGNDLSARDLTKRAQVPDSSPFKFDWLGQKNFDDACPVGPWIVPAEDIADPQNVAIKLWVNDVIKQDSHTAKMIFSLAEQISHISSRLTLHPGDLILTGTPAGVGLARKEFLKTAARAVSRAGGRGARRRRHRRGGEAEHSPRHELPVLRRRDDVVHREDETTGEVRG